MLCINEDYAQYTFSERFGFIDAKSKKTKRLIEDIVHFSLTQSSICNSLKKTIKIDKEKKN